MNLFTPFAGCGHVDEVFYLFKQNKLPFETIVTDQDKLTSKILLKLWTDFAKTGNPTPHPDPGSLGITWTP